MRLRMPIYERWLFVGFIVGIVSGLAGVTLSYLIKWFSLYVFYPISGINLYSTSTSGKFYYLPLLMFLGGLASGILTTKYAPEAEGHGTDSVIEAIHRKGARIRSAVPIVKMIASTLIIGTGGSAGKEGPIALTGAGFASVLSDKLGLTLPERRLMVLSGMAGGLSAVFKAPLGSMIFALEVPYRRDMELEAIVPIAISSVTAYAIAVYVEGVGRIFSLVPLHFISLAYIPHFVLLGVILGLFARFYVRIFYGVRDWFKSLRISPYLKPALGAIIASGIIILAPQAIGQGYPWAQSAIYGRLPLEVLLIGALAKILATSFSIGSGGSGGVFAPTITVGGFVGGAMGLLFSNDPQVIAAFTIVGMISFLAGAGKVPLAAIVMVAEMTGGYQLIVHALAAVTLAYLSSGSETIYEKQVDTRAESPYFLSEISSKILSQMKVKEIMSREVITVSPDDTLRRVLELITKTGHLGFPVVENDKVVGIITQSDVLRISFSQMDKLRVKDVMSKNIIVALPEESVDIALRRLVRFGIGRLPVVESRETMKLIGIITKKDIIRAYESLREMM
jgi:CIC family chloride channel protein